MGGRKSVGIRCASDMLKDDVSHTLRLALEQRSTCATRAVFDADQTAAAFGKDYTAWIWTDKGVLRRVQSQLMIPCLQLAGDQSLLSFRPILTSRSSSCCTHGLRARCLDMGLYWTSEGTASQRLHFQVADVSTSLMNCIRPASTNLTLRDQRDPWL